MSGNRSDIWPAKDAWLLREVDAGRSILEIARLLNVADTTVRRRLWQLRPETYRPRGQAAREASIDIPIDIEEPRDTDRPPPGPSARVESVSEPASSPPTPTESMRSEWSPGQASRERLLERQVSELRAQNKTLLDEIGARDAQLDVAGALATVAAPTILPTPRSDGSKRHGVPVLLCSDWHVEEPVNPESVNGLNEYNLDIADACIDRMADAFEWLLRDSRFDCREGVVWLGGDLFSGYIHDELAEHNALSPVETMMWLQHRLLRFFGRILAETNLERIVVVCNDGNHGRLTHKIRVATRTENSLEWLLYQTLARHYANEPRLRFQIAEGVANYLQVFGTTICFQHGDTFRYQGGVGGLLIPVRRGFNELRKYRHVDHLVMGHFHQRLDAEDVIVNGSMIGITPYGMSIKASPEPRQQSWFLIDQERGKCLSAPVWLPRSA